MIAIPILYLIGVGAAADAFYRDEIWREEGLLARVTVWIVGIGVGALWPLLLVGHLIAKVICAIIRWRNR